MKRLNIKVIMLVMSVIFFIGLIGLIIIMNQAYKQSEDTTTYYSATVSYVNVTDTGESIYAQIYTEEYETVLEILPNICKNINMDDVKNLKIGQRIFFRIQSIKSNQMNEVLFVDIVSLRTESKDIFSLDEYNSYTKNSTYHPRIAAVMMATFFLTIALICFFSIKRKDSGQLPPLVQFKR